MIPFIWFAIKSFLFSTAVVFAVGIIRLLYGINEKPRLVIKDPASLKKGDILLIGKQSITYFWYLQLVNVLFRNIRHRFWVHTAIYGGDGKVWEGLPEGIQENDLTKYLTGGFSIRALRHRYIHDDDTFDGVIRFCAAHKGPGYDHRGAIFYAVSNLIPIGFNFVFDNAGIDKFLHVEDTYFCSELVVDAFKSVGYPISPLDGWRVRPIDFITNPLLKNVE